MSLDQIIIYKIYEYLFNCWRGFNVDIIETLYLSSGSCQEVKFSSYVHLPSHLSDSAQCWKGLYFLAWPIS